ncbi:hypothetical protein SBF1_1620017 [Candidatus Desulfosporosinus infrequens]|uniref:Uncharacterized protein n=1 Tax=Candidatus Desulfosporosinus infrequens TaxID=2043169 RepID=A0A2U3KA03_9FIRM|nr:hypothetical protein SBF1_1620017 [Candidatus Desulfosporosinus infrequens]
MVSSAGFTVDERHEKVISFYIMALCYNENYQSIFLVSLVNGG